jgi:hypothetical protein
MSRSASAAEAWEDAVRLQRWASPDHADFYVLAGEVVRTVYALEDLTRVLGRQVAGYGRGRAVFDDSWQVEPAVRLADAVGELSRLGAALGMAERAGNAFWSAIGHIRVAQPLDPNTGLGLGGRW